MNYELEKECECKITDLKNLVNRLPSKFTLPNCNVCVYVGVCSLMVIGAKSGIGNPSSNAVLLSCIHFT